MTPIKFKRLELRRPRWDPNPKKSKTDNHDWRIGMFIIFEDYDGKEFDYMPTWKQLDDFNDYRKKAEERNKQLAREKRELSMDD